MGTITRIRVELKYLIPPERLPEVISRIPDSDCRSYRIATTYLDRPDRSLSLGAVTSPFECTKIRLREYGDGSPFIWIEVKMRSWAWTRKFRLKIEKKDVAATLRGEPMDRLPSLPCPCAACIRDVSEAYHRFRESSGGQLVPVGTVRALRRSFSVRDIPMRFSVDENVEYYRPPEGLYETRRSMHDDPLGEPVRRESCAVLEMKEDGSLPGGYSEIVEGYRPADYSKFRTLLDSLGGAAASGIRDS